MYDYVNYDRILNLLRILPYLIIILKDGCDFFELFANNVGGQSGIKKQYLATDGDDTRLFCLCGPWLSAAQGAGQCR